MEILVGLYDGMSSLAAKINGFTVEYCELVNLSWIALDLNC